MAKNEKKKVTTTTVTTTVTEEILTTPTNEKTHIICILDRSGSMHSIINDSIGGFNTFLKKQKDLPDEATITVVIFDDQYELIYDNIDIKSAELLTDKIWSPRGNTALYDAIGKTITTEKAKFSKLGKDAPAKVLVCLVTDGQENSSHEYKSDAIKKMIKSCEDENWNFIYLAANQDAFAVGSSFGMSVGNTYNYTASSRGVADMSNVMFSATASYRGMDSKSASFKKMSKSLVDLDENDDAINLTNNGTSGTLNINGNNITTSTTYVTDTTIPKK
jgi:uncharacterized protein YegL